MKTKLNTIYLLAAFVFLGFTGCIGQDGIQGPAGYDGRDGRDANVYYSEWFSPTEWLGDSGDWYFVASAPDLNESTVENGIVLAYVWLSGDLYESSTVRPLPAYAVGVNWSFLIHEYGSIEFTCDMIDYPFNANDKFRFIAVPGTSPALKAASQVYKTKREMVNMSYEEACKRFDIKD